MDQRAASEELDGFAIGDGGEAFEEISPGMEAVHFTGLVGFIVEGLGVVLKGKGEDAFVEVEEMGVGEGFAEVAPGEGGLELEGAGHAGPPDGVRLGDLFRQKEDGVEAARGGEIALHRKADVAGVSEPELFASKPVEPEEGAGDDPTIEKVAVAGGGAELEGHGKALGVPGGVDEEGSGAAGGVEKTAFACFFEEITEAGDSVTSDFG